MKLFNFFISVCFCAGLVSNLGAQVLDEGPYEQQLRPYSEFHGEFVSKLEQENEKKRESTDKLKVIGMQLKQEHNNLQTDIEMKEVSVEKLKTLNEKLQATQSVMQEQFVELEGLFKEQRSENDRLKKELEESKTVFYSKMLEFYEQEDVVLAQQIAVLTERQQENQRKIKEIRENLTIEK